MAKIFGETVKSEVEENVQTITFRIPAFTETIAIQRAKINARAKGFNNFEVKSSEVSGKANIPGLTNYDVEVSTPLS